MFRGFCEHGIVMFLAMDYEPFDAEDALALVHYVRTGHVEFVSEAEARATPTLLAGCAESVVKGVAA